MNEDLVYEILSLVAEIPEGRVATYGQIARLIGREKNSRLVGKTLSVSQAFGSYPCHRVVNHAGRLAPGWPEQHGLLEAEGVEFRDENHVDLPVSAGTAEKAPAPKWSGRFFSPHGRGCRRSAASRGGWKRALPDQ